MLRVMQIGYGYWGANIARKLVMSAKLELRYLCESDEKRAADAGKALPETVEIIDDYREHLSADTIDAVVIATQTDRSFLIALDAIEAGKHIFIEKPVATNVERTKILLKQAEAKNLILHCDHLMIYNPIIRYIKGMIERGEMGDLMYIDISRVNLGPIRKDVNAMMDLAVHDIAVIDYLTDGKEPYRLSAFGTASCGEQETITYLTMNYEGFLAHINSSWVSPVKVRRSIVAGTRKMVIFDDVKADKLRIYDSGIDVVQGEEYGSYEYLTRTGGLFIPHIPNEDSLLNSLEHFAGCVEENRVSLSGPKQCLRVMKILEWAQQDLKKNRRSCTSGGMMHIV